LHHPLLVRIDHAAILSLVVQRVLDNIDKSWEKLCLIVLCFPFLDHYHIFHSLDDVKLLHVDSEFALLDLGEIQHVLNHELEAERAGLLHLDSIVQLNESQLTVRDQQGRFHIVLYFCLELGQIYIQVDVEVLFLNILGYYAI
jgi:hypothetical protein